MSSPLRIVFMGTPFFAVPTLQALLDGPDEVVTVVCQPDRKQGRGRKFCPPPVKKLAMEADLPILQPSNIRDDAFFEEMSSIAPDLLVVAAYGKILPERLLTLPRFGALNVHGSLLPKYRGAAPIQQALIEGETETGITIMQMDAGMDSGDILLQSPLPITEEDTAGTLFNKLAHIGSTALMEAMEAGQL